MLWLKLPKVNVCSRLLFDFPTTYTFYLLKSPLDWGANLPHSGPVTKNVNDWLWNSQWWMLLSFSLFSSKVPPNFLFSLKMPTPPPEKYLRAKWGYGERTDNVDTYVCAHAQPLSRVWLTATPWTVAHQGPLSMGFSRQEYWNAFPFPPPGHLLNPGIEPASPVSPALAGNGKPRDRTQVQILVQPHINCEALIKLIDLWHLCFTAHEMGEMGN